MVKLDNKETTLSIIVPIYNVECYLNQCLESIKVQSFCDFECILIDDGSTDKSGEICDVYAATDSRFHVIHQENSGLVGARIAGWRASKGVYIGFVDSDDWIEPDMYAQLISALENEKDVDIAITGIVQESDGSSYMKPRKIPKYQVLSSEDALAHMLTRRVFAWELCCKVYRRQLFFEEDFRSELTVGEDFFTSWCVFRRAKRVVCLPNEGYHYRLHPSSMSHQKDSRQIFLKSLAEVIDLNDKPIESLQSYIITWYLGEIAIVLLENGVQKNLSDLQIINLHLDLKRCMDRLENMWLDTRWRHFLRFLGTIDSLTVLADSIESIHKHIRKISKGHRVVIYGAGCGGRILANILTLWHVEWNGFVVSDKQEAPNELFGKPVWHLSQLSGLNETIFLLGLSSRYAGEVRRHLHSLEIKKIYWPVYMQFLTGYETALENLRNRLIEDVQPLSIEKGRLYEHNY